MSRAARSGWLWLALSAALVACAGSGQNAGSDVPPGKHVDFAYYAPDGTEVSSATVRGRATVLLFLTTYDLVSQAQARRVDEVIRAHRPRSNAVGIVLEPPRNAVFAPAFASSLGLAYPVVLADYATLHGTGPFGRIGMVPTVIVLDAQGRLRWRSEGPTPAADIDRALSEATR